MNFLKWMNKILKFLIISLLPLILFFFILNSSIIFDFIANPSTFFEYIFKKSCQKWFTLEFNMSTWKDECMENITKCVEWKKYFRCVEWFEWCSSREPCICNKWEEIDNKNRICIDK